MEESRKIYVAGNICCKQVKTTTAFNTTEE